MAGACPRTSLFQNTRRKPRLLKVPVVSPKPNSASISVSDSAIWLCAPINPVCSGMEEKASCPAELNSFQEAVDKSRRRMPPEVWTVASRTVALVACCGLRVASAVGALWGDKWQESSGNFGLTAQEGRAEN